MATHAVLIRAFKTSLDDIVFFRSLQPLLPILTGNEWFEYESCFVLAAIFFSRLRGITKNQRSVSQKTEKVSFPKVIFNSIFYWLVVVVVVVVRANEPNLFLNLDVLNLKF